jgi:glycosyltransferase involved in cell wall biosynthesis
MAISRPLLIDISMFINWRVGHTTGIQRVICELVYDLADTATAFALCVCNQNGQIETVSYSRFPPLLKSYLKGVSHEGRECLRELRDAPLAEAVTGPCLYLNMDATWLTKLMPALQKAKELTKLELISLIYDITPCLHPQWRPPYDAALFIYWVEQVLRMSDRLLTISEFSMLEIRKYCDRRGIECPRIDIIRLGDLPDQLLERVKQPAAIPRRPIKEDFFLVVGSLDPRKNHRLVYSAWKILFDMGIKDLPPVVIAGNNTHPHTRSFYHEVTADPELGTYFYFISGPEDWELDWYYKKCMATIYPSIYEGWGLPVAESLCYGKVTFALNVSSISEINPSLISFIPANNPSDLAAMILRFLSNKEWRRMQEERIARNLKPWRWCDTTRQIKSLLEITD